MYSFLSGSEAKKVKKFDLQNFTDEVRKSEEQKKQREAEFKPDHSTKRDNEFVLGGFDFEYGGGYRRDEIMKKTLDEADAIIADAKRKVASIEHEAFEKGHKEGVELGKRESSAEVSALLNALKDCTKQLTDARNEFYSKAEKEMVDLIILICSEILVREIKEDNNVIIEVIRKAAAELHSKQSVTIRMNKADVDIALSMRDTLLQEMESLESVEFVSDNSIVPGGCLMKTNIGMIDATVEGRLADIHRNLKSRLE